MNIKQIAAGLLALSGLFSVAWAQATLKDPDNFNPDLPCTFVIDLTKCTSLAAPDMIALAEAGGSLYIWTWNPGGDAGRADENKNGEWSSSNEGMTVTYKGNGIVEFDLKGLSPVRFYKVDAKAVYDNDFQMLIKAKDGSAKINDNEPKTEDLKITVEPPSYVNFSIPPRKSPTNDSTFSRPTEALTIFYDNKLEKNSTMQGLSEVLVVLRAKMSDNKVVTIVTPNKILANPDGFPEFIMTPGANNVYMLQLIPEVTLRAIDAKYNPTPKMSSALKVLSLSVTFVTRSGQLAEKTITCAFSDCP